MAKPSPTRKSRSSAISPVRTRASGTRRCSVAATVAPPVETVLLAVASGGWAAAAVGSADGAVAVGAFVAVGMTVTAAMAALLGPGVPVAAGDTAAAGCLPGAGAEAALPAAAADVGALLTAPPEAALAADVAAGAGAAGATTAFVAMVSGMAWLVERDAGRVAVRKPLVRTSPRKS